MRYTTLLTFLTLDAALGQEAADDSNSVRKQQVTEEDIERLNEDFNLKCRAMRNHVNKFECPGERHQCVTSGTSEKCELTQEEKDEKIGCEAETDKFKEHLEREQNREDLRRRLASPTGEGAKYHTEGAGKDKYTANALASAFTGIMNIGAKFAFKIAPSVIKIIHQNTDADAGGNNRVVDRSDSKNICERRVAGKCRSNFVKQECEYIVPLDRCGCQLHSDEIPASNYNRDCVFPFEYRENTYNNCSDEIGSEPGKYWCKIDKQDWKVCSSADHNENANETEEKPEIATGAEDENSFSARTPIFTTIVLLILNHA